tara:strand:+ start:948 stop:1268 length:321 start_codon:yes stop_codon:yes gene_type:complete
MTTNEIEKQLRNKSKKEISEFAETVVNNLREFPRKYTNYNRSGMSWYHKGVKPHAKFEGQTVDDPWNHLDWHELTKLILRNLEENWLDDMVEKKSKELLSKIDLLG